MHRVLYTSKWGFDSFVKKALFMARYRVLTSLDIYLYIEIVLAFSFSELKRHRYISSVLQVSLR